MSLEILQEERYSPALVGKEIQRLDSPTISGTVITVLGTLTYFGIATTTAMFGRKKGKYDRYPETTTDRDCLRNLRTARLLVIE